MWDGSLITASRGEVFLGNPRRHYFLFSNMSWNGFPQTFFSFKSGKVWGEKLFHQTDPT